MRLAKSDGLAWFWLVILSAATAGSLYQAPLTAPFAPLNLAYLVLPFGAAVFTLTAAESLIWGLGLYALARAQGLSRFAAVLGATLGLSARHALGLTSPAAPWLPWIALLLQAAYRRTPVGGQAARLPWVILAALPLAAVFLGDEGNLALTVAVLVGVAGLLHSPREGSAAVFSGAALLLALALSAPRWTLPLALSAVPFPPLNLSWEALGHLLTLLAWAEARSRRRLSFDLMSLPLSLGLMLLGIEARALLLVGWSLSAARGAEALRCLRATHGPEGGISLPVPHGVRRWLLLGTADGTAARLAAGAFWGGGILFPLTGPAWLLGGIVVRVSRCPIYVRRRPVWEGLALGVSALPLLLASPPAGLSTAEGAAFKAWLEAWWTLPTARAAFFVTFLGAMSLAFLSVLWLWRRLYGAEPVQSDLHRVARNSTMPVVLNLFNRGMDFVYAALLLLRILGPANAGDYSTAIVIYTWLEILVNFGLDAVLMREVVRTPQGSARYLYNAAVLRVRVWLLLLPVVLLIGWQAPLPWQVRAALMMLYLGLLPATLCRNFDALFYAHELVAYPALVSSIATFIKVSLGALVLLSGRGIVSLAANALVTNVIVLGILATLAQRHITALQRLPDAALRRALVSASWPLMLRDWLYTLYYRLDLVALQVLAGSLTAGWYSVSFKFLDTIAVVPQYFALALFPVLARQAFHDRERFVHDYRLSVKVLLALGTPIALGVTLYAQELVLILGDAEYLPHAAIALRVLIWMILLNWANALGQYVLIAQHRQKALSAILGLALGLSIVGNLQLIPRFGYLGAAGLKLALEGVVWALQSLVIRAAVGRLGWGALWGKVALILAVCGAVAGVTLPLGRGVALGAALVLYGILLWRSGYFSAQEWITLERLLPQRARRGMV